MNTSINTLDQQAQMAGYESYQQLQQELEQDVRDSAIMEYNSFLYFCGIYNIQDSDENWELYQAGIIQEFYSEIVTPANETEQPEDDWLPF